ncbi:MAG TPA: hypothetical protein DCE44_10195 [Verrucomicrobiales bacterium]|nr:hypothetical protein [Verrucomicrobiales bacterium]
MLPVSRALTLFGLSLWFALRVNAADPAPLNEHLEPLRPMLGKTWRGEFKNSTPEKPIVDIAKWERALNGQAVRILHSINNGSYGGETLIFWSPEKKSLVYHYFTTQGFQTTGTMTISGGKIVSFEKVTGDADGVTEVKGTSEIRADGTMVTQSEYLKNGKWEPGHSATYREDPKAEVVFK